LKAEFANLEYIFRRSFCHVVPIYQRPYVWKQTEWSAMWADVRAAALEAEEAERDGISEVASTHFIGAIVLEPLQRERRVNLVGLVDGQQRLTTLQVLIAACRDAATERGAADAAQALTSLTTNDAFVVPEGHPRDAYKVWPARWDFDAFRYAVHGVVPAGAAAPPAGRLVDAREWFGQAVEAFVAEAGGDGHQRLFALQIALRERIGLVEITLQVGEDAQVIFETLNSGGQDLLASDLVKNALFRQATDEDDDLQDLYDSYWTQFDKAPWTDPVTTGRIRRTRIDVLLSHWLTIRAEEEVAVEHLFTDFKRWRAAAGWSSREVMADLARHAGVFAALTGAPRTSAVGRLMHRLIATGTTTPVPLLIHLHARSGVPQPQLDVAVAAVDSFLVRRSVCSLTTKDYNRLFLSLLKVALAAGDDEVGGAVQAALLEQDAYSRYWPDDVEFFRGLMHDSLYHRLKGPRLRTLLEGIEEHLRDDRADQVFAGRDDLSVEHLLPQKWREHWPVPQADSAEDGQAVGDAAESRDLAVNRLGNLTLTTQRLNSQMSHAPWPAKREHLRPRSTLLITTASVLSPPKGLPDPETGRTWHEAWDERRIDIRTAYLAGQALAAWPRPDQGA
jgi:hypothetical protein